MAMSEQTTLIQIGKRAAAITAIIIAIGFMSGAIRKASTYLSLPEQMVEVRGDVKEIKADVKTLLNR